MSGVPNPPAFPSHYGDPELTDPRNRVSCGGMTLRDYLAGQWLAGCGNWCPSRNGEAPENHTQRAQWQAEHAYAIADAMLAARGAS